MMRFFGILFLVYIAWKAYEMFRDVFNGTKGVKQGAYETPKTPKEGHITIRQTQNTPPKKVNNNVGEYVDYKEVKDKK